MKKRIKLIWEFRGPSAQKTAEHHVAHLKEYIAHEGLDSDITGYKQINEMYSLAFMVVMKDQMIKVRDALRPHSGELYEDQ